MMMNVQMFINRRQMHINSMEKSRRNSSYNSQDNIYHLSIALNSHLSVRTTTVISTRKVLILILPCRVLSNKILNLVYGDVHTFMTIAIH